MMKTVMKTITNPDGTAKTTTETIAIYETNLPNDESEETSEGTSTVREELEAGTSMAKKINWTAVENWLLLKEAMQHLHKPRKSREKDVGKEELLKTSSGNEIKTIWVSHTRNVFVWLWALGKHIHTQQQKIIIHTVLEKGNFQISSRVDTSLQLNLRAPSTVQSSSHSNTDDAI
eukprot:12038999-Ditylum_brightwellii.AAC.1